VHPALRLIADRQLGVFTSGDARRAGYRDDQMRSALASGVWTRLRRGVYVETATAARLGAGPRGRHLLASVAVLVSLGGGPVLSHASAARLHRFVLPREDAEVVRLTDSAQWRAGRGYRVARAVLPDDDAQPFLRFRATTPARTLVDCAREWTLVDSVVAMDAALHVKVVGRPLLRAAVHAARHWVGVGTAARALSLADGRAESPLETRGRLALLAAGLPAPELQVEIHGPRGFVGRVDAWYDDAALALEFDGQVKYTDPRDGRSPAQVLWDEKRREDAVRDLGIRVVRIVNADLGRSWSAVTDRLAAHLADPSPGPRRFTIVRRPEPGSAPTAA
jgi:hypothetical protein